MPVSSYALSLDRLILYQGGQQWLLVSPQNKQEFVRLVTGAVVQHGVVHAGGIFRVTLQKVGLKLELERVCPVIIPLAVGDVFAPRVRQKHLAVYIHAL